MSRMILGLAFGAVCLSSTLAVAQEPINRDGHWGLGANTGGLLARYWTSQSLAFQLSADFSWNKDGYYTGDQRNMGGSFGVIPALVTRGNVVLESPILAGYSGYRYKSESDASRSEHNIDTYSLKFGLGIEYHFDELPNLTFGGSLAALTFSYGEEENIRKTEGFPDEVSKDYPKNFSTFSSASVGLMYYF